MIDVAAIPPTILASIIAGVFMIVNSMLTIIVMHYLRQSENNRKHDENEKA